MRSRGVATDANASSVYLTFGANADVGKEFLLMLEKLGETSMSQIAAFVISQSGCAIFPDIRMSSIRELSLDHNGDCGHIKVVVIFKSTSLFISGNSVD